MSRAPGRHAARILAAAGLLLTLIALAVTLVTR